MGVEDGQADADTHVKASLKRINTITLILPQFLAKKLSSAYNVCCICSIALKTNFIMKPNTMDHDETAPKGV